MELVSVRIVHVNAKYILQDHLKVLVALVEMIGKVMVNVMMSTIMLNAIMTTGIAVKRIGLVMENVMPEITS